MELTTVWFLLIAVLWTGYLCCPCSGAGATPTAAS